MTTFSSPSTLFSWLYWLLGISVLEKYTDDDPTPIFAMCWLLRISISKNVLPKLLSIDGNRSAHGAVHHFVLERMTQVASTRRAKPRQRENGLRRLLFLSSRH